SDGRSCVEARGGGQHDRSAPQSRGENRKHGDVGRASRRGDRRVRGPFGLSVSSEDDGVYRARGGAGSGCVGREGRGTTTRLPRLGGPGHDRGDVQGRGDTVVIASMMAARMNGGGGG